MKMVLRLAAASAIFACFTNFANAETYYNNIATGAADWNAGATWVEDPGNTSADTFPNVQGDVAVFQVTSFNGTTAQTGNRTISVNNDTGNPFTAAIGQLDFNLNLQGNTSRNIINQGTGDGKLIFDGAGSTNSQLNVSNVTGGTGNGIGLNDINAPMQLNDQLQLNINSLINRTDNLNLRIRGLVNGSGGITRNGPTNTLLIWPIPNTAAEGLQYTGPTYLGDPQGQALGVYGSGGGGRNQFVPTSAGRISTPTLSAAFYVVGNAQLGMSNDGAFQFGAADAVLHFNSDGSGNSIGPGALRPERTATRPTQVTISNTSVSLDGPITLVHSEGVDANGTDPSLGYIQFNGVISGGPTNRLQLTTTSHSANHGTYVLAGANTFSGGVDVMAGRLSTDWLQDGGAFNSATVTTHPTATFGTGDIHVVETPSSIALSISSVAIPSGVLNAIGNTATLSIDGINTSGFRSAFVELGDAVTEVVGKLVLDGSPQLSGVSYGSTASSAIFQDNTYFTGTGMVQVGALGDFSGNGVVDANDYVLWRKSYSANTALYDLWRNNFGNTAPGSGSGGSGLAASNVPEPSAFVLLALAGFFATQLRRKRTRS